MRHLKSWLVMMVLFFIAVTSLAFFWKMPAVEAMHLPSTNWSDASPESHASDYLRSLGNRISRINETAAALSPAPQPPEVQNSDCSNGACSTQIKDVKYETCSNKNDYLEDRISNVTRDNSLMRMLSRPQPEMFKFIEPNCVQGYMELFPKQSVYRACEANTGRTKQSTSRPCMSDRYVNLVSNSFNLAGTCLHNIPTQVIHTVAKLFPHESGYHINAMRPGGYDGGVGQLIGQSIQDVNEVALPEMKRLLMNSPEPACRAMHENYFKKPIPLEQGTNKSCDRLNVENGNPIVNIAYSMALLNLKQKRLNMTIFKHKEYGKYFDLPESEMNKIKEAILIWGYNLGEGGISGPVTSTLRLHFKNQKVTSAADFIKKLSVRVGYVGGSPKARYNDMVQNRFNTVNKNLGGGQCLKQ